ncbi:hypothetical protein Dip510_001505 [Elusimicrobium posterum]|uniref:hypothetical protein n=1 Tax=Elusimicrobium posterum TaxID=3116653 RepID=UPI003C746EE6
MKKITFIIFIFTLICFCTGCGGKEAEQIPAKEELPANIYESDKLYSHSLINLKIITLAQQEYFKQHGAYAKTFEELGISFAEQKEEKDDPYNTITLESGYSYSIMPGRDHALSAVSFKYARTLDLTDKQDLKIFFSEYYLALNTNGALSCISKSETGGQYCVKKGGVLTNQYTGEIHCSANQLCAYSMPLTLEDINVGPEQSATILYDSL